MAISSLFLHQRHFFAGACCSLLLSNSAVFAVNTDIQGSEPALHVANQELSSDLIQNVSALDDEVFAILTNNGLNTSQKKSALHDLQLEFDGFDDLAPNRSLSQSASEQLASIVAQRYSWLGFQDAVSEVFGSVFGEKISIGEAVRSAAAASESEDVDHLIQDALGKKLGEQVGASGHFGAVRDIVKELVKGRIEKPVKFSLVSAIMSEKPESGLSVKEIVEGQLDLVASYASLVGQSESIKTLVNESIKNEITSAAAEIEAGFKKAEIESSLQVIHKHLNNFQAKSSLAKAYLKRMRG